MSDEAASSITTDIVTVPDFTGSQRVAFVLRALFFLASWDENASAANGNCQVHLASIGDPPPVVRAFADEVGARTHVFNPKPIKQCRNANKLRGLEIPAEMRKGERVFLLDTDIFFVNDPTPFLASLPPDAVAASPANKTVPDHYWKRIYKALEIPEPEERIPMLNVELGLHQGPMVKDRGNRAVDLSAMWPYWNGGIVLSPWQAPMHEYWAKHLETIFDVFAPPKNGMEKVWLTLTDYARVKPKAVVSTSDMAGLATAIEALKVEGFPFQRLPDELHARKAHFAAGKFRFEDISVWHATAFGRGVKEWAQAETHTKEYAASVDALLDTGAKRRGENAPPSTVTQQTMESLWNRVAPFAEKYPVI